MILLSAGHYPESPGACHNDFCEHAEAMKWIDIIQILLRPRVPVAIIPTGPLSKKISWVNHFHKSTPVNLAVEIHFNGSKDGKQRGSETLYCPGSVKGQRAARIVQDSMSALLGPNRGAKEGWHEGDQPGVVDYPGDVDGDEDKLLFLSKTTPIALILEPEFIYNRLVIESLRQVTCEVLSDAIIEAAISIKK